MSKKIFITGGAGYIGSHTCIEFLKSGHKILVYDDLSTGSFEALERVKLITNKQMELVQNDIRNKCALEKAICDFQPDVVVHFAGLKSVAESMKHPMRYYDVNVRGSLNLLEAMSSTRCQSIVFSSSATVYAEDQNLPYDENHMLNPINPYGRTKLIFEQILNDWVRSFDGNRAVCLRYFNPVGAHASGLIGENPHGEPNNLMPFISEVAAGQREYLSIYGNNYSTRDGTGERDFIHVTDLAYGHLKAVERLTCFDYFQVLNLGTGMGTTVKELISAFEKVSGKKINSVIKNRRSGDVARSLADPSLAAKLLGISSHQTIEDMCRDTWHWKSKNPNGFR